MMKTIALGLAATDLTGAVVSASRAITAGASEAVSIAPAVFAAMGLALSFWGAGSIVRLLAGWQVPEHFAAEEVPMAACAVPASLPSQYLRR